MTDVKRQLCKWKKRTESIATREVRGAANETKLRALEIASEYNPGDWQ